MDLVCRGIDLFNVYNPNIVDKFFEELCEEYCWDLFDLPVKVSLEELFGGDWI